MSPANSRTYALLLGSHAGHTQDLASDIALLEALDAVDEIHVWLPAQDMEAMRGLLGTNSWEKVAGLNAAGAARDATIYDALTLIRHTARDEDLVLIAD